MVTADHSGPQSDGAATPRLINDEWLHLPATKAVFAALSTPGVTVRAVGGTVRNALLGEAITDIDLATTAAPEETIRAAKAAGLKAIPTGLQHGTVTVVADRTPFEVTTLRLDVRTDGRHAEVAFTDDWHGDAARRDFTMNALYCDADGMVFDPLGGLADCMARRVRFIGDPDQRIAEDYLRIVRFYRFTAQYGGHSLGAIDMAGRRACTRGRHGLFRLSRERIGSELGKLLAGAAAPTALIAMFTDGVLLDLLRAPARLERFAAWHHVHRCLQGAARAAHDDHADAYRADGRAVHPAAALAALAGWGAHSAVQLAAGLRLSNADAGLIAHVLAGLPPLRVAMQRDDGECDNGERDDWASSGQSGESAVPGKALSRAIRRVRAETGGATCRGALELALAERHVATGRPLTEHSAHALARCLTQALPEFPLQGRDLLSAGFPPGPELGRTLNELRAAWLESDLALTRRDLLALAAHP